MIAQLSFELRQRKLAILLWVVGSIVLSSLIVLLFPSIRHQANQINQAVNQLPAGLRGLKTGGSGSVNVADPIAFLNSQLFYATLPILWIILAVTRGGSVLAKDEREHTIEVALARPISRTALLAAKGLSLLIEFVAVALGSYLALLVLCPLVDLRVSASRLLVTTLYTAAFALSFGLIAFTLQSVSLASKRVATIVAIIVSFGSYLIASLSGLTDWLKVPAKVAPFHYFAPDKLLHGQTTVGLNVYLVGILVLTVVVSWFGFRRRDLL